MDPSFAVDPVHRPDPHDQGRPGRGDEVVDGQLAVTLARQINEHTQCVLAAYSGGISITRRNANGPATRMPSPQTRMNAPGVSTGSQDVPRSALHAGIVPPGREALNTMPDAKRDREGTFGAWIACNWRTRPASLACFQKQDRTATTPGPRFRAVAARGCSTGDASAVGGAGSGRPAPARRHRLPHPRRACGSGRARRPGRLRRAACADCRRSPPTHRAFGPGPCLRATGVLAGLGRMGISLVAARQRQARRTGSTWLDRDVQVTDERAWQLPGSRSFGSQGAARLDPSTKWLNVVGNGFPSHRRLSGTNAERIDIGVAAPCGIA